MVPDADISDEKPHQGLNVAVEVKRFNLLEACIDPAHPHGLGTPSPRSVEAFERARLQAEARRWAIPSKEGVGPPEIWMVFDIRAQGVTDVADVGTGLKRLLSRYRISYDQLKLLTDDGLVDLQLGDRKFTVKCRRTDRPGIPAS